MKYIIEKDPTVQRAVIDRHRETLSKLRARGFTGVACYAEKTAALSLLIMFPVLMLMQRRNEYVKILPDLSFKGIYPLMVKHKTATFALVNALGMKFYTQFLDGTLLISNTMSAQDNILPDKQFYKYHVGPNDDIWIFHQEKIVEFTAQGKQIAPGTQFGSYVQVSSREEEILNPNLAVALATSMPARIVLFLILAILLRTLTPLIAAWIGKWILSVARGG